MDDHDRVSYDSRDEEIDRLTEQLRLQMSLEREEREAQEAAERDQQETLRLQREEEEDFNKRHAWRNMLSLDEVDMYPMLMTDDEFLKWFLIYREKVWWLWYSSSDRFLTQQETIDLLEPVEEGICCLVYQFLNTEALINNPNRDRLAPPLDMDTALQVTQRDGLTEAMLDDDEHTRVWDASMIRPGQQSNGHCKH